MIVEKFSLTDIIEDEEVINIVDIGAMAIGKGNETYAPLSATGKIRIIGFEPNKYECDKLNESTNSNCRYYPYFIGNGQKATYYQTNATMTGSLYEPRTNLLSKFQNLNEVTTLIATEEIETIRLDDIHEIKEVDYIKIDVQGSELQVFEHATNVLAQSVIIHTEVAFVEMYKKQPMFADIDTFLRSLGFQFHTFYNYGSRCLKPFIYEDDINKGINQRLWADAVYVRDFMRLDKLTNSKLKKMAVILNDIYQSFDFCYYVLAFLDKNYDSQHSKDYLKRIEKAGNAQL